MAQQGKPGWYDDGAGQQRWWDGRGWTGYTQPPASAAAQNPRIEPVVPAPAAVVAPEIPAARQEIPRRRGVPRAATAGLAMGALLFGLIFGGVIGGAAANNSAETTKLTASVAGLQTKLQSVSGERDTLKAAAADVATQADQLSSQKTGLAEETTQLSKRSKKLEVREKKVALREAAVKREAAASTAAAGESSSSDTSDASSSSSAPSGATAQCSDGSYSYSAHRSGTCSHHGGVSTWL